MISSSESRAKLFFWLSRIAFASSRYFFASSFFRGSRSIPLEAVTLPGSLEKAMSAEHRAKASYPRDTQASSSFVCSISSCRIRIYC